MKAKKYIVMDDENKRIAENTTFERKRFTVEVTASKGLSRQSGSL